MHRSNLPLMNGGAGSYASSSTSPTTSNILPSQSDDEQQLRKKVSHSFQFGSFLGCSKIGFVFSFQLRVLHGLGFC